MLVSEFRQVHNLSDSSFRRLINRVLESNPTLGRDDLLERQGQKWVVKNPDFLSAQLPATTRESTKTSQNPINTASESISEENVEWVDDSVQIAPYTNPGLNLPNFSNLTGGLILSTDARNAQTHALATTLTQYNAALSDQLDLIEKHTAQQLEALTKTKELVAVTRQKQEEIKAAAFKAEIVGEISSILINQEISSLNSVGK